MTVAWFPFATCFGKLPSPGVVEVISTSAVSPGRSPYRRELKICRSLKRPIPVVLSGVRFRGRVMKHGSAPGSVAHAPMGNSWAGLVIPASQPSAAGFPRPP